MPASENETSAEKRQDNGGAHTPGQWVALPNDPKADDYWRVSDGEDFICQMFSKHGEFENAKANARLIAAAPSLLEALRQFAQLPLPSEMHAADDWHSTMDRHLHVILTDAIRAARSAIQRAEGGQ